MTRTVEQRSDRIWAALLGLCGGSILAVELVSLRTEVIQTLCRSLRRWFAIDPGRKSRHYLSAGAFFTAVVAFWIHLETLPPLASRKG